MSLTITKTYLQYKTARMACEQLNIEDINSNRTLNKIKDKPLLDHLKKYVISKFRTYIQTKSVFLGEVEKKSLHWHYTDFRKRTNRLYFHPMENPSINIIYQKLINKILDELIRKLTNVKRLKKIKSIINKIGTDSYYNQELFHRFIEIEGNNPDNYQLIVDRVIALQAEKCKDLYVANKVITHFINNTVIINRLPLTDYQLIKVNDDFRCHKELQDYRGKEVLISIDNDWCNEGTRSHPHWQRTIHICPL